MDDLISEFLVETNESLQALDQDFVKLEQNPGDSGIIGNIFRVMHTIKGTCGFLGLSRLEKLAHAAENIMDKIRSGAFQANPAVISLILEANDSIKQMVEHLETAGSEKEGDDSELIARLNACAETGTAGGVAAPVAAPAPVAAAPAAPANKTSDLDEEIDFTPVLADYAGGSAPAPAPAAAAPVNKTTDLDQEIDFTPVKAPYAGGASAQLPAEVKQQAVTEGLKTADAKNDPANSAANQSIRVGLEVLENLMQMVGELVLTRNELLQIMRTRGGDNDFSNPLQRLNLITSELQEGVMKTRMQPIGNAWAKFPRLIRDLSLELGKKIDLKMIGAETELDRQMLEAIKDPLTHMVRNSADHGVETPADRAANGKPETGTVTLSAYHEGGHIIIKIADDGKGLSVDKIKAKALANGVVTESQLATMSDKQIYQFIYKPGFSTAEKVTAVSGRGVGMDVVVTNIERIGGTVELDSKQGKGTEFFIKLPLTLAIMPVLIVESAGERFAIPQIRVAEIVSAEEDEDSASNNDLHIEFIHGAPVLRLRGRLLPLVSLSNVLKLKRSAVNDNAGTTKLEEPFVLVCEVGSQQFGIMVDKVFHTEEIVVKPVSPLLKHLEVYAGCTILGDGNVIMIIDPNGIVKTSGIDNLRDEKPAEIDAHLAGEDSMMNLLMFKAGGKSPKVVPLDLIARLEEVEVSKVEWSGDCRVVQYRGGLTRLISCESEIIIPETGKFPVIVFTDNDRTMGMVVQEIMDIVRSPVDVKSSVTQPGLLGSLVVSEQTTDLIDVSYFFSQTFGDWLGSIEAYAIEGGETKQSQYNRKKHVLLVDDSPFFRKFMKPVLLVADYNVTLAENGVEALTILEEKHEHFDIVVSDIDMPEMNGLEFVKRAKKDPRFARLPYIALTSHKEEELGNIYAIGFNAYVAKSSREQLVNVISDTLRNGTTMTQQAAA